MTNHGDPHEDPDPREGLAEEGLLSALIEEQVLLALPRNAADLDEAVKRSKTIVTRRAALASAAQRPDLVPLIAPVGAAAGALPRVATPAAGQWRPASLRWQPKRPVREEGLVLARPRCCAESGLFHPKWFRNERRRTLTSCR